MAQHKQALVEYQTALDIERSAHAERGLGLAYEALSAFVPAAQHLRAALEAQPEDALARVALARVQTRFGQYEQARAELTKTLEHDPGNDEALLLLSIYADAPADIQRALDLLKARVDPSSSLPRPSGREVDLVLADLLARSGRSTAGDKLRELTRYSSLGNERLTLELARASSDRENYGLARQLLAPLVERRPTEEDAWQALAAAATEVGQYREARAALEHLGDRKADPEVRLITARLELEDGLETRPTQSLRELLQQLPLDEQPLRARARRLLARALLAQRKFDDAERELGALLEERAGDVEGSLALAEQHLERSRPDEAIPLLTALIDAHSNLAVAYGALGRAYLEAHRADAARSAFERFAELAPDDPAPRYWLAQALNGLGKPDEARQLLSSNLERFAEHRETLTALLALIERRVGVAAARATLLRHAEAHKDSKYVAAANADWLLQHQSPEQALAAYRQALLLDPSFFPAVSALSRFYARNARSNLARGVIDGALVGAPDDVELALLAARVASDLRQDDDARQYCERALGANPEHPRVLAALAIVSAEAFHELERAKELAARAYAAAPARPEVLDAFGWVKHLTGDSAAALPYLEQAERAAPDDPRIIYHHGSALFSAGQAPQANVKLARVLNVDPLFPTAKEIRLLLARHGP